jgi:hypothetical protein
MCTLLAQQSQQAWVVGSNSDNPYDVRNRVLAAGGPGYSYLAVQVESDPANPVPWNDMLTRGINSAGLAFTYAFVAPRDHVSVPAQTWTADLLATAADVKTACAVMESQVGAILTGNYLLADASGAAIVAEVSPTSIDYTLPRGTTLACANHWQSSQDPSPIDWAQDTSSDFRTPRAWQLLDTETVSASLADHSGNQDDSARDRGSSLCNHGRTAGTTSSEILQPAAKRLWFAHGWPCGTLQGHEQATRRPWGSYLPFSVPIGEVESAELVTTDGKVTVAGVGLLDRAALAEHSADHGSTRTESA